AGDQASTPLEFIRSARAAIRGNVFLGNAVNDRANSGPHAGARAHGARLVRRVEHEVRQIPAMPAGYVFERFQLYVFDARPRSLYSVTGAGNHHFAPSRKPRNDRANGIVAPVTGAFGLSHRQLHEFLSRSIGSSDHLE